MWYGIRIVLFLIGLILSSYNLIDYWRKNKKLDYKSALYFVLFASLLISEV